jgi:replicative DNA helicase
VFTLTRARNSNSKVGDPLPPAFRAWDVNTVRIRQGQFHLIAAAPGVGKSLVALTIAMKAKVPTFYFSADSDAWTMYIRGAAMLTGWSVEDIENQIKTGNTQTIDAKINNEGGHIRFDFDSSPSFEDIDNQLLSFASVYGEYPQLIVVDNLSNVYHGESEGFQALERTCDYLHDMARETGAAIVALHHVTGEYEDGSKPVPLSGLRGKVSKVPEVVVTLYRGGEGADRDSVMNCCPVKNRGGKADPNAGIILPLRAELERMRIEG